MSFDDALLSWDADAVPATYSALSSDRTVRAVVNRHLEVLTVEVLEPADPDELGAAMVDAVNRALLAAQNMDLDSLQEASSGRVAEFNALLDGLEENAAQAKARIREL